MTAAPTPDPSSAWYVRMPLRERDEVSDRPRCDVRAGRFNSLSLLSKDVDETLTKTLGELGVFLGTAEGCE